MAIEQTLSIIKPDATARNVTGQINAMIEKGGARIDAQKRPFYDNLCTFMSSGPIVLQVLEGDGAIGAYRRVMGATDPEQAKKGTIRKRFGQSMPQNSVHGSDSPASAVREIAVNFAPGEIVG